MDTSYIRVALVLPPTQSFFMPYSAPASLAALLQQRFRAHTLVVDAGVDWLWDEVISVTGAAPFTALQEERTYADLFALREAYAEFESALSRFCSPWSPERVLSSGRYSPPGRYETWQAVDESLGKRGPFMFDQFFEQVLIPKLRRFRAHIIGLSVPFDWMLWPAMRLLRWLRRSCPDVETILGGPAIERLWQEEQREFFEMVQADWVAIGDGGQALCDLVEYSCRGVLPQPGSALIRLPADPIGRERRSISVPGSRSDRIDRPIRLPAAGLAPDYTDLDLSRYLRPEPVLPIPASDGCFYGRCRFCSRQRSDQSVPYVEQSPDDVAAIMRRLRTETGAQQFILAGDIFTHKFLLSLARALVPEQGAFSWFCEASFKAAMAARLSPADCELLYRGGCRLILNGLESGSSRVRTLMDCPVSEEAYERTLIRLVRAGIVPYVTIVFGYPGEGLQDLLQTVRFIQKHADHAVFATSRFEIVPTTPLAKELLARRDARCTTRPVLEGGMDYDGPETLNGYDASVVLGKELGGMFGAFQEFYRHIPVMLQLLKKTAAATSDSREITSATFI